MSHEAIMISASLVLVAATIVFLALSILRSSKPAPHSHVGDSTSKTADDDGVSLTDAPASDETAGDLTVMKKIEFPGGEVEVLVAWDPHRDPSAFRGKTLEEAMQKARDGVRAKRAMQGEIDH